MSKRVCVLVVTFNRKEYLRRLIAEGLWKQTYPVDTVLIFDNHSTDGTAEMLQEMGLVGEYTCGELSKNIYEGKKLLYYQNLSNDGGSAGFHNGIRLAHEQNTELVWAMDDDVLPEEDCLERLVESMSKSRRMCIPCRTDENFCDYAVTGLNLSNPFLYSNKSRKTKIPSQDIEESINIADMPFEGPLIDRTLIDEIGYPVKDLFIFYDDTEYAQRALGKTDIGYIKKAVLHKQIIPPKIKHAPLGWRAYYSLRNQCWFDRNYGKNIWVKKFRPIYSSICLSAKSIILMHPRDIKIIWRAYIDGIKGIMGRTVEPGGKV